jgi:hypothetical protein
MAHIAVLAGNAQEFKEFKNSAVRNGSLSTFYFVTDHNYYGHSFDSYMIIGTFWNRTNAREIFENIKLCMKHPYYYDIDNLIHEN